LQLVQQRVASAALLLDSAHDVLEALHSLVHPLQRVLDVPLRLQLQQLSPAEQRGAGGE
jgi:hypothetical protein